MGAARGKLTSALAGDLKCLVMCRDAFEEVEDGTIFCSFDNSSTGNQIKSFTGQAFSAANGKVRFILLTTHFPMKTLSSMMEDTVSPKKELLDRMKNAMAHRLKSILQHLLQTEGLFHSRTMVIVQGDLNSRYVAADDDGGYVDVLSETLQDLQCGISAEMPADLRGEWMEVATYKDASDLPATYRFARQKAPVAKEGVLRMRDIYPKAADGTASSYRDIQDKLRSSGLLKEWGLYDPSQEGKSDENKFKPSRLPGCTERVLYYAPYDFLECCTWEAPRGYEVNFLQIGSDHKPVMLEAKLRISTAEGEKRRGFLSGSGGMRSFDAAKFRQETSLLNDEPDSESDASTESQASQNAMEAPPMSKSRTAIRSPFSVLRF